MMWPRDGGVDDMLLASLLNLALLSPAPGESSSPDEEVHRAVLENGLTVLLAPDHSSPLVAVGMMYSAGARNERAGITGIAHYVEHMNFRSTKNFPGSEITDAITRLGGRWTGYTWIDQTYYAETVHRDALDRMLDIEFDRMANALYEPEDFEKERTSVIAELHSYDDPREILYDAVLAASFEIHPYRHNTIGWLSDVEQVTRDEAYRFYRRFYHPNNAVLVVVGDMEPSLTLDKIRQRFGPLGPGGEPTVVRTVEPLQKGQRRVTIHRPGPHAEVLLAFRAPALTEPEFPAIVLFDALLAGGKGFHFLTDAPVPTDTPLARATVQAGLATGVRSDWQASRYPYVYTVSASVPEAKGLPELEKALFRALEEAAGREWSDAEIRVALRQMRTGWASDMDDKADRAHQLAFFELSGGHHLILDLPARIARVGREELRRFAREWLNTERATVGWFVPREAPASGGKTAGAKAVLAPPPTPLASPPPPSPPPPPSQGSPPSPPLAAPWAEATFSPSPPITLTLKNGIRVILAPRAGSGIVAMQARIEAGSAHDGTEAGLSALVAEWLSRPAPGEPTGGPALAFTLHEEPDSFVNFRWIEARGVSLAEDLPALLQALGKRLRRAGEAVPDRLWRSVRESVLERARELEDSSQTSLWQRGLSEIYAAGTPLATPAWGRPSALAATKRAALEAFLRRHVTPERLTLALSGPVEPKKARQDLESTLETWATLRGALPSPESQPGPRGPHRWKEVRLKDASKTQDEILVVWPGDRTMPWDQAATQALVYLLGETGYAGRLGRALVAPGLVYLVDARLEEEGLPGLLAIRTAAAPADTPEVLRRIRGILEEASQGGFTLAELEEAKTYLRGKAARSLDGAVASAAATLSQALAPQSSDASPLTLDQLNDTSRRLFKNGAPVALVAGPHD